MLYECVLMEQLLTSREKDLILVKKDFLVRSMRSSSASSPSIIAQLSAVGSSHSLPPELIISLEYLYCNLQVGNYKHNSKPFYTIHFISLYGILVPQ